MFTTKKLPIATRPNRFKAALLALITFHASLTLLAGSLGHLRCEYLENPLGVDIVHPRLSWQITSSKRGEAQTAYQIMVASSSKKLVADKGDLWDSGRVDSDQSIQVPYSGQALTSHQQCFWKVRYWDAAGRVSRWSEPALWTMGILSQTEWEAQWIGRNEDAAAQMLKGCSWIWFPEGQPERDAPLATRYFRRTFELPAGRTVKKAELQISGDNEFAFAVNAQHAGSGSDFRAVTPMDVAHSLRPGKNVVAGWVKNVGEGPNPAGLLGLLRIEFESGEPMIIPTDASWKTTNKENGAWTALEHDDSTWVAARILGPVGMQPWGEVFGPENRVLPARLLRREFHLEKRLLRATVSYSGLGLSELYLNGQRIGDSVLSPGLTEYPKRALYVTHEVAGYLKPGANAIGVLLGNGRFHSPRAKSPTSTETYGYPKLRLQLRLQFTDGSVSNLTSDPSWKLSTNGPITANNEYDGEDYDACKEMPGWNNPGYDDSNWQPARIVSGPGGILSAEMANPIRVTATLKPLSLNEIKPGVFIYDLGQNMVGWCRIKVSGPAGTVVSLRHAERLKDDGSLYMDNLRGAKVTDHYTLKGKGQEIYEPRFTYHGFRYVEVTGFPGKPTLATIEGRVVNDDLQTAGSFTTSQPVLNRNYTNIVWGTRGNYRSIPTDCPQRDERQGWLGDRSAEARGESLIFDTSSLYAKWLRDMADGQKDNGSISDVCPSYWALYNDNVTWPASAVIIPGALLDHYADTALIARHYPAMVKWMDHMATYIKDGIIEKDNYGDWCVPPEDPKLIHSNDPNRKTAAPILATSYFIHCLDQMTRYAKLLDKSADQERFAQRAKEMRSAFNERFYKKDLGYYDNGTQTACVLPLAFDLVPASERGRVFDRLVTKITQETHGHVGTGLIGGQWLNRVLTAGGRPDLSYTFSTNRSYPSWGYMADKGATTIWELWNGDTADPAMNSGNHVMLVGDLVIWFYESLAGIKADPEHPGFKHIIMKPELVGDLQWVNASYRSPYGRIISQWSRKSGRFEWNITIPPNTTATLFLPAASPDSIREGGRPANQSPGLKLIRTESNRTVYSAISGSYKFTVR